MKQNQKRNKTKKIILIVIALVALVSAVIIGMCLFNERPAVQPVSVYQEKYTDSAITVFDDGGVEIIPQESSNKGIIFYVGAQITPDAYIPLLAPLAEEGYSCYIPKLTCNMAALEPNAAREIISSHPEIAKWYIAGHSMGGLTASGFACDNAEDIKGLILIASYTNRDMSDVEMPILAVYGNTDGVMNKKLYDKRLSWNSKDFEENILAGANHAQFGDYGRQPRDNDALIDSKAQQEKTISIMLDWLCRH